MEQKAETEEVTELEYIKCQREQLAKERKEIEEWKKKWQEYDQDFASHQREIWKGF